MDLALLALGLVTGFVLGSWRGRQRAELLEAALAQQRAMFLTRTQSMVAEVQRVSGGYLAGLGRNAETREHA